MDQGMIEDHLRKIPVQIREVVQSLDTDEKWAVYIALLENERMSFSALRDLFEMNPSQITKITKNRPSPSPAIQNLVSELDQVVDLRLFKIHIKDILG